MRYRILIVAACLSGCNGKEEPRVAEAAVTPRPPVGLYGDWVHVAPAALRGDTLSLRPDSTARGLIPWDEKRAARVTRWKLVFGSRDPVAARVDWRLGHNDGGDAECSMAASARRPTALTNEGKQGATPAAVTGCQSMPLLCLGTVEEFHCETFHYTADSLLLQDGSRFVRAKADVAPELEPQVTR
jgi:hypothetical protein